jgi:tetratricopeptide (TPR) repeat protein
MPPGMLGVGGMGEGRLRAGNAFVRRKPCSEPRDERLLVDRILSSKLGTCVSIPGDSERATELFEESMDLFREQGDKQSLAFCLTNLAMLVYSQGDLGRAGKLTEEAVALFRELGARGDASLGLCNLGWIALLQNDLSRAAELYEESIPLAWDTGLNPTVQSALEGYACLAGAKGEAKRAARLWGAAQTLHQAKGILRDTDFLAEADARIPLCVQAWGGSVGGGVEEGPSDDAR